MVVGSGTPFFFLVSECLGLRGAGFISGLGCIVEFVGRATDATSGAVGALTDTLEATLGTRVA